MSTLSIIIVVALLIIIFVGGIWFTSKKFKNIESGETKRRSHIEEDMEVEDRERSTD